MNLQISVKTNQEYLSSKDVRPSSLKQDQNELIQSAKNVKQLSVLESQGVTVPASDQQLIRAIDRAFKALQGPETTLEINIHEKTHQLMVKVLNKESGEVLREIPPEKTLDLVAKMMEIAGIIVDKRI